MNYEIVERYYKDAKADLEYWAERRAENPNCTEIEKRFNYFSGLANAYYNILELLKSKK